MILSDQELIRKARTGDNRAFELLWARYESRVVALCRRYLDGPHRDPATDANDLANETFILALHGLDRYEDRTQENRGFETWLLEIAKRLCLKFLTRQRRRQQWRCDTTLDTLEAHRDSAPPVAREVEEREVLRIVAQEINALPETYRLPFKLCLEERSHREIAETLGISVDSAMQRVHRARRILQPRLAPLFGIAPGTSGRRPACTTLREVEQALSEIVRDSRIVSITLPGGGEMQLCLRIDRRLALREEEITARHRRLLRRPRAWKPYLEFAELCYHCGRWKEAREAYRTALTRNPACYVAALRLGEMLQQEAQAVEATRIYQTALEQSPPPEIAAQLQAELLAVKGEDVQAVAAYRAAILLAPTEKGLYYGLHRVLARLSRYAEQLENLAVLREIAPEELPAYDEAYTPCARLQRWDLALPLLERAVEIDPNHPVALKHLFQVRMNQKRFDAEALALAERLVRIAPDFVESWSELAWIYAELGRDEEALAVLKQFLSEHPSNAEAHAALAWRYYYLQSPQQEAGCALRAYELAPQNWHVCWTLLHACSHAESAAHAQTIEVIPEAQMFRFAAEIAARFPQDAFLLEFLCDFYTTRGREEEAVDYLRQLQTLQPENPALERLQAHIYRRFLRWQEAVREYRRLLERPGHRTTSLLASLGEALLRLEDPAAEAMFAEADEHVQTWRDYLFLADLYERCGMVEKAIDAVQHLLSLSSLSMTHRRRLERQLKRLSE